VTADWGAHDAMIMLKIITALRNERTFFAFIFLPPARNEWVKLSSELYL
jgi:hypothetical protein